MFNQKFVIPFVLLITLVTSGIAFSQSVPEGDILAEEKHFPIIEEFKWLDYQFLDSQRKRVSDLVIEHYRRAPDKDEDKVAMLQKIIDDEIVDPEDMLTLQALGVILGDQFISTNKKLDWKTYEDGMGKSRVVCVVNSQHCIFPMTILARRITIGIKPDVTKVIQKVMDEMAPYMRK